MARDRDLADRQRARLVAAEDVHAAEVLDGGQPLDDDLLARHPAPRREASVTETIMGRSSGVSPTPSATAKRKDSSGSRRNSALTEEDEEDQEHHHAAG